MYSEKDNKKIEDFLLKCYEEKYKDVDFYELPLEMRYNISCFLWGDLQKENSDLKDQISKLQSEVVKLQADIEFLRIGLKLKK